MMVQSKKIVIVGYSGHAYVVIDALKQSGFEIAGYCDSEEKLNNPYGLTYFGKENEVGSEVHAYGFFAAVGNNTIREKIITNAGNQLGQLINAIHPRSVVDSTVLLGHGILIAANAVINAQARIGNGVICNTSTTIEHECVIGEFTHIAPGAVLCGNVRIGARCFIGANSVIAQGLSIGNSVTIGAGSVILRDVPDNATVIGNPGKQMAGESTVNK